MPCYILRAGETEMVKIGWADEDVESRRSTLQTAHWEDLILIRQIEGERWIEGAMHKLFAANRVRREWFRFDPEMLTVDPVREDETPRRPRKVYDETIRRVLSCVSAKKIAEHLKLVPSAVTNWEKVPPRHVPRIAALTGIPEREIRPDMYPDEAA